MEDTAILALVVYQIPVTRRRDAILEAYNNERFTSRKARKDQVFTNDELQFLRGEKFRIEELVGGPKGGQTCELTGEKQVILCMHLWSLKKRASPSPSSDEIWKAIQLDCPECVSWGKEYYGHFWGKIDHKPRKNEPSLRDQAEKKGLLPILDAYKDMERHFKEDNEHLLVNWPSAYLLEEENPNPTLDLWKDMIRHCTREDAVVLLKSLKRMAPRNTRDEEL